MKGLYVAIITPFDEDYKIDYESLNRLLENIFNSYVDGIICLGSTGENCTLNVEEKIELVNYIWSYKKLNRIYKKIVVGIGGNDTIECIDFGKKVCNMCDYMMITVPNYNKPQQEGIYQHFKTICSNFKNNEFILYNIPSRTGINMSPECISRCYNDIKNIVAIKESSNNLTQVMDIKKLCNINILAGDDASVICINSVTLNEGLVSVIGNLIPNQLCEIYYCEDKKEQLDLFYKAYDLIKCIFIESNPAPIKYLLKEVNLIKYDKVRKPLVELEEENKKKLVECYNKYLDL